MASIADVHSKRLDIQILRGMAVIAVIAYHVDGSIFKSGYLGVDSFFVISGFVITPRIYEIFIKSSIRSQLGEMTRFAKKRFWRIVPAACTTIAFSAVLSWFIAPFEDLNRIGMQGIYTLLLAGNFGAYKFAGNYFQPNPNLLIHTWSLGVEEQFYAFFPILLFFYLALLVAVHGRKELEKRFTTLFYLIIFVSLLFFLFPVHFYSFFNLHNLGDFAFYSPLSRAWQFLVGGVLSLRKSRNNSPTAIFHHILFFCLLFFALFQSWFAFGTLGSIFVTALTLKVLQDNSALALPEIIRKPFIWIGNRSYSIYLIHMPVIYLIGYSPFFANVGFLHQHMTSILLTILISFAGGIWIYQNVENKYRKTETFNFLGRRSRLYLIVILIMPILGCSLLLVGPDQSKADANFPPVNPSPSYAWDSHCLFFSSDINWNSKPCEYGNLKSKTSMLLFGDSHAAADSAALVNYGISKDLKISVFAYADCPYLLPDLQRKYRFLNVSLGCQKHNVLVKNWIDKLRPSVLLYAHRSSLDLKSPDNSHSRILYDLALIQSVETLDSSNKLVVIGSEPEYIPVDSHLQQVLHRPGFWSATPFQDNNFWKEKFQGKFYIDTINIFCSPAGCRNKSRNGWFFEDSNHLSRFGGNQLIPKIDIAVSKILGAEG